MTHPADGLAIEPCDGARTWVVWNGRATGLAPGLSRWLCKDGVLRDVTGGRVSAFDFQYDTEEEATHALHKYRLGGRDPRLVHVSDSLIIANYHLTPDRSNERGGGLRAGTEYLTRNGEWMPYGRHDDTVFHGAGLGRGSPPAPEFYARFLAGEFYARFLAGNCGANVAPDDGKYMTTVPPDNRGGFLE